LNKSKDYSTHYMAVGIDNNLAIHFEFAYNNIKANGSYVISDFGKKNIEAKINELKAEQAGNLIKLSDLNNQLENENNNKMVLNKSKDYSKHYMAVGIDNNLAIHFEFAYNNIKANGSYVISDFGKKNIEAKINELKAEQAGNLIKLSDLNNQLENENKNKMVLKEELQNAKKGPDMTEITKLEDDINSLNKNISVLKDRLRGKNNLSELVREEWIKNKGL